MSLQSNVRPALAEALEGRVLLSSDLDLSFGKTGEVRRLGPELVHQKLVAVKALSDGKSVVAGIEGGNIDDSGNNEETGDIYLSRYRADGSLDPTFGNNGTVDENLGGVDQLLTLLSLPDGSLIAVGTHRAASPSVELIRFTPDGSLDRSFADNGVLNFRFGAAQSVPRSAELTAVGKVLIFAVRNNASGSPLDGYGIARINPDGTFDSTLGNDGQVIVDPKIQGTRTLLSRADGKMVFVGGADTLDVEQLNSDASIDKSFADHGIASFKIGRLYDVDAATLQSDGKIVAATTVIDGTNVQRAEVVRLTADGKVDKAFGGGSGPGEIYEWPVTEIRQVKGGLLLVTSSKLIKLADDGGFDVSFGSDGRSQDLSPFYNLDNRPLFTDADTAGGSFIAAGSFYYPTSNYSTSLVAHFTRRGKLDTTFGLGGVVSPDPAGKLGPFNSLAIQPDGKIVAVGKTITESHNSDFLIARFNPSGHLDDTFGDGGINTVDFDNAEDIASAVAILADGKIVVGGGGGVDHFNAWTLCRLTPNGTLDASFGTSGKLLVPFASSEYSSLTSILPQPDGELLLAGTMTTLDYTDQFALARLLPNGSLDSSFDQDGRIQTSFGTDIAGELNSALLLPDGKILVGGALLHPTNGADFRSDSDIALVRYNADGSRDNTFGSKGKVFTNLFSGYDSESEQTDYSSESANALAVASDGTIVVLQDSGDLLFYDSTGKLGAPLNAQQNHGSGIAGSDTLRIDGLGRIYSIPDINRGNIDRYNPSGSPDVDFVAGNSAQAFAFNFDASGRVVAVGQFHNTPAIFRLLGTTKPVASFMNIGASGKLTVTGTSGDDLITLTQSGPSLVAIRNGIQQSVPASKVKSIELDGLDGSDRLALGADVMGATLDGGNGADTLIGGNGADTFIGGDVGNPFPESDGDTVDYSGRSENLSLSIDGVANDGAPSEHDNIHIDIEIIIGGTGNDLIRGTDGDNTLDGGAGNDTIIAGAGADQLIGNSGNDSLDAGEGNDSLFGGLGNDILLGGAGNDFLSGSDESNTISTADGADVYHGGDGVDTISFQFRNDNLNITEDDKPNDGAAGEGDNVFDDIEEIDGGGGNDLLSGSAANNTLDGGAGSDTLYGLAGNDRLYADGGDHLFGGDGNDTLRAKNFIKDSLDGGAGFDQAKRDRHNLGVTDYAINIEEFQG